MKTRSSSHRLGRIRQANQTLNQTSLADLIQIEGARCLDVNARSVGGSSSPSRTAVRGVAAWVQNQNMRYSLSGSYRSPFFIVLATESSGESTSNTATGE